MKQFALSLQHEKYLPKDLSPGILYVSIEYAVAGHLCACGCGNKVVVPLNPTAWAFTESNGLPTLYPSIGNWQLPCRSHYFITDGRIIWARQWTDRQIAAGRQAEQVRREAYYTSLDEERGLWSRFCRWIQRLF